MLVKIEHKISKLDDIVEELTDKLFEEGWRFKSYVKESSIDYSKWLYDNLDRQDKANNEPVHRQPNLKQVNKYYKELRQQQAREAKSLAQMLGVVKIYKKIIPGVYNYVPSKA